MWLYVLHEEAPGVGEHEGPLTIPLRLCKGFPEKKKKVQAGSPLLPVKYIGICQSLG